MMNRAREIYIFFKDQQNRTYLWSRLCFSLLLLFMWLFDSNFLKNESNTLMAVALVFTILATLVFGVILQKLPFSESRVRTFILADVLITFVLILPVYHASVLFAVLCLILLAQINFLLTDKNMQIVMSAYIGLVMGMYITYSVLGKIEFTYSEAMAILIFNVVGFMLLFVGGQLLEHFQSEIDKLQAEKNILKNRNENLVKDSQLTDQRLDFLNKDLRRKSFEIQNILSISGQLGVESDSKKIISNFLLTMVGQLGSSHALYLGKAIPGKNYFSIIDQKGIRDKRLTELRIYKDSYLIQIQKAMREPLMIRDIPKDQLYKDERELLGYFQNDLLCPIMVRNKIIGMFIVGGKISGNPFSSEDLNLISILTNQAAFIIEQVNANDEIYDFYYKTVRALLRAQELKDRYSRGHAVRTAQLVQALGKRMNYTNGELKHLTYGTILHDIGKIALKDDLLLYNKKFNGHDDDIKKKILDHTVIGASILKGVGFRETLVDLALHHHEWFNGRGYPHGLSGNEISLGVRILSVCNAYDAMMSDKPYRKSLQEEWAREQLNTRSGKQFDPEVVDLFLHELKANPDLSKLNHRP